MILSLHLLLHITQRAPPRRLSCEYENRISRTKEKKWEIKVCRFSFSYWVLQKNKINYLITRNTWINYYSLCLCLKEIKLKKNWIMIINQLFSTTTRGTRWNNFPLFEWWIEEEPFSLFSFMFWWRWKEFTFAKNPMDEA